MTPTSKAQADWERASEPYPLFHQSGKRTIRDDFRRMGNAIAVIDWGQNCELKKLEPITPREGGPTTLLAFLRGLADKHGIAIRGNATPYLPSRSELHEMIMSQEQLEKWYQDRGFQVHRFMCGAASAVEVRYPHR